MSDQRLIDANKLKEYARSRITYYVRDGETEAANYWRDFIDAIDNSLTVPAVVLPCEVGDTVYYLTGAPRCAGIVKYDSIGETKCTGFYFDDDGLMCVLRNYKGNHGSHGYFGKTVFLTREEAEAALRRAEG